MKNLFTLFALVFCFALSAVNTASAQHEIKNGTNCDFEVKIGYALSGSCSATGFMSVFVPANTNVTVTLPAGNEIYIAKGRYAATMSCPFYIGISCTPYPTTVGVSCSTACGDYTAVLNPALGIKLY